jgi:putative flippase GtrA
VILQLLRFVAIGFLNTAIDFIILNFISKSLGISSGLQLGTINILGFAAAVTQSYFWNRYWAFGANQTTDVMKNFTRLVIIGGIGVLGFLAALFGAQAQAVPLYYIVLFALFVLAEIIAWTSFGISRQSAGAKPMATAGHQFIGFVVVSVVGLVINSALVAVVSYYLSTQTLPAGLTPDLLKNIAKIAATGMSLVWNFIGYKLIVFKR